MKNKNDICHFPYFRNSIAYDDHFWYRCVKWWYLQIFFHFFKILIFLFVRGLKGQKNSLKWQNIISGMLYISGTMHHMIVIYGTLKWNNDIFRWFFHFFKILIFWIVREGRVVKAKNGLKWQKILSTRLHISGIIHHVIVICGTQL